jgi:simple sugar transport system ATP-binding protein
VAGEGIGVVFISHDLPHVLEVSDRIEVLRQGRRVARFTAKEATTELLIGAMTGALVQPAGEATVAVRGSA